MGGRQLGKGAQAREDWALNACQPSLQPSHSLPHIAHSAQLLPLSTPRRCLFLRREGGDGDRSLNQMVDDSADAVVVRWGQGRRTAWALGGPRTYQQAGMTAHALRLLGGVVANRTFLSAGSTTCHPCCSNDVGIIQFVVRQLASWIAWVVPGVEERHRRLRPLTSQLTHVY